MRADQTWTKASDRLMISQPGLLAANRLRSRESSGPDGQGQAEGQAR
jgi:hypothetical protein